MLKNKSFQGIISTLEAFWQKHNCAIIQPYDVEMGAGTFHPATVLYCLGAKPWRAAYVQPSRRPTDSRYGIHPNRMQKFHQFQVILKPAPSNIQDLYLESLKELGLNYYDHDIRFVEDDWESPTLGASGLGWEVWCDGMEVSQFTYMQQMGGIECNPVAGEITYGLERLALYIQGKENIYELDYNTYDNVKDRISYGDVYQESEKQFSAYALEYSDTKKLYSQFRDAEEECLSLLKSKLTLPAYDQCIKASHIFNLLDAKGVISVTERASYITKVRNMAKKCCESWLENLE
jgi:glycyl-tRNA synthetase alpha chain